MIHDFLKLNKLSSSLIPIFLLLVCVAFAPAVSAQTTQVRGTVTDRATGEAIIGANILQVGTTNGTVTDIDGNYTLNAPRNATLRVSSIGYITQNVTVPNQNNPVLNIQLLEDAALLEEVVVVGYGTMRKSDVTGSIAVATAEDLLRTSSFSPLTGLKGVASGVNVFLNSGIPGGAIRVVVRGQSSIMAQGDPLYIVDGVAMTSEGFRYMNPNDVERMEVLKDASSTAIYGARGAHGVILVTTKRGATGERTSVSYKGYASVSTFPRKMATFTSDEYIKAYKIGMQNAVKYGGFSEAAMTTRWTAISQNSSLNPNYYDLFRINGTFNPQGWKDLNDNTLVPLYDTDWQGEATRNAISHSHQLDIQHGTKNSSTGVFLNYTDNQGLLINTYMKRIYGKLTHDAKPLNWLSTSINLTVNHTQQRVTPIGSGGLDALRMMIEMPPILPNKYPDGSWSNTTNKISGFGYEAGPNPRHYLELREDIWNRTNILGNAALTFHLAEGLELKTQFGVDQRLARRRSHEPFGLINQDNSGKGRVYHRIYDQYYWQQENYLTYKTVIDKHRINAMVGISWQEDVQMENVNDVGNFITNANGVWNIGSGSEQNSQSSSWSRWAMNSYFTRLGYTYNDKYMATFTARADGSSKFGANNKWGFFPSLGIGWMISNEKFMQNISWLDQLKLHTSYGAVGNSEQISNYQSLATFGTGTTLINGVRATSANPQRMANPDLKWEVTRHFDLGFNLNTFSNRFNLDISWYHKYTDDLLLNAPIPISSGYNSIFKNVGAVSNRGWDFLANIVPVRNHDFEWNISLNANYNANKVERLNENNADIFVGDSWLAGQSVIMRVGEPLGCFWGFERLGIKDQAYVSANGGRVGTAIRSTDRTIIGKGMPDWTGSIIQKFRVKNFDFSADFQYVIGGNIRSDMTHTIEDRFGLTSGITTLYYDAWTEGKPTNVPNSVQAIRLGSFDGQDSTIDSRFISSASYFRGSNFDLGYTLSPKQASALRVSSLRVYVSANNLFVFHSKDFKGYDPEVATRSGQFEQNVMNYQYPVPTVYTLGLNVTF